MIAQIRGSLDVGPVAGKGLPASPPSPPAAWGCPLDLSLHGMGMGDSPCASGGRAPAYTWFSFCLLVYFVRFKPEVGFTSSPAMVSALGRTALGLGRRAVGGVSAAVLSWGAMRAEPPASRASPMYPAPLKHPPAPRLRLCRADASQI